MHEGEKPVSAEALMRSRYTAFVLNLPAYLFVTEDVAMHEGRTVEAFAKELEKQQWVDLKVTDSGENEVSFEAALLEGEMLYTHKERSLRAHHRTSTSKRPTQISTPHGTTRHPRRTTRHRQDDTGRAIGARRWPCRS